MSAKPEAADAGKAPAKSKKLLIIVVVALLVVILAGVAAFVVISKQKVVQILPEVKSKGLHLGTSSEYFRNLN